MPKCCRGATGGVQESSATMQFRLLLVTSLWCSSSAFLLITARSRVLHNGIGSPTSQWQRCVVGLQPNLRAYLDRQGRTNVTEAEFEALPCEPQEVPGFPRYKVDKFGTVYGKKGNPMKPRVDGGYSYVNLFKGDQQHTTSVHSIIAKTFIGPRPSCRHQVDHINRRRNDNRATNLRWATLEEQRRNSNRSGCCPGLGKVIIARNAEEELLLPSAPAAVVFIKERYGLTVGENTVRGWVHRRVCTYGYSWSRKQYDVGEKRPIPPEAVHGTQGYYATSKGYIIDPKGRISIGHLHSNGYRQSKIRRRAYQTHRLIAWAFHGKPAPGADLVHHIDGMKHNNTIENLEFVTAAENSRKSKGRRVEQFDRISGALVAEYTSIAEASMRTCGNATRSSAIGNCLHGLSKSAFGFKWRYVDVDL